MGRTDVQPREESSEQTEGLFRAGEGLQGKRPAGGIYKVPKKANSLCIRIIIRCGCKATYEIVLYCVSITSPRELHIYTCIRANILGMNKGLVAERLQLRGGEA